MLLRQDSFRTAAPGSKRKLFSQHSRHVISKEFNVTGPSNGLSFLHRKAHDRRKSKTYDVMDSSSHLWECLGPARI